MFVLSLSFAFMRCSFFSSSCDSSMTARALHVLCFGGCRCSVLPRQACVLLRYWRHVYHHLDCWRRVLLYVLSPSTQPRAPTRARALAVRLS
jgi:hypothetical protein